MRVDVYLKKSCLVKQRSLAQKLVRGGHVSIPGRKVKPASEVQEGEQLTITFPDRRLTVKILAVPSGNISRAAAREGYEILQEEWLEMPQ